MQHFMNYSTKDIPLIVILVACYKAPKQVICGIQDLMGAPHY